MPLILTHNTVTVTVTHCESSCIVSNSLVGRTDTISIRIYRQPKYKAPDRDPWTWVCYCDRPWLWASLTQTQTLKKNEKIMAVGCGSGRLWPKMMIPRRRRSKKSWEQQGFQQRLQFVAPTSSLMQTSCLSWSGNHTKPRQNAPDPRLWNISWFRIILTYPEIKLDWNWLGFCCGP